MLRIFVLFVVYFTTAKIGQAVGQTSGVASLIWPPAGIALAALLVYGYKLWPAVLAGGFMLELSDHISPLTSLFVGIGTSLEALTGAYLLRKVGFDPALDRNRDVMNFIIFGALASTMVSAIIGVGGFYLSGEVDRDNFLNTLSTWWAGDVLGVLVTTPLILAWVVRNLRTTNQLAKPKGVRAHILPFAIFISLVVLSIVVFADLLPYGAPSLYKFLITPFLAIIVIYYGQRGNVSAIALVSFIAMVSTNIRYPARHELSVSLLVAQQFIGIMAISFMFIAAALAERDRAQRALIRRTVELDKQGAYFKQLNDAKDEFISLASHQLRTPATAIKMYLGMALMNPGALRADQKANIDTAYNANERLIQLIGDLLTIAEIGMGELALRKEKTNIKKLIDRVIDDLSPVIKGYNQEIVFSHKAGDYTHVIDKKKMCIVIENLIENASKYSRPGKKIEIDLSKKKGNIVIKIKDEGVGISKKEMPKLFKKFSRIPNELSTERGGTGLGLYIVEQILSLHNGSISVTSIPERGTTFVVTLR